MKKFVFILLMFVSVLLSGATRSDRREMVRKVYGRIRVVQHAEDYCVRIVQHAEDLRVRVVQLAANSPGLWEFVEHAEDFSIRFVDHAEDFSIRFVQHAEGPSN